MRNLKKPRWVEFAKTIAGYCFALNVIVAVSSPAHAAPQSYFSMSESYSDDIKPFPKWTGMMERFGDQRKVPDDQCGTAQFHPCEVKEWKAMLEGLRSRNLKQQLDQVNDFGNAHPYTIDQVNWGMEDYWETPYEFMEVNGDCEDYAITKYYSLRSLGVPADRLRIIIVQDFNLGGIIHAVLGVYGSDTLYILDNQIKQVMEASRIYHYKPIYSINEQGWWAYHSL